MHLESKSEAVSSIPDGQILADEPFVGMECRDGLLGRGNQVLVVVGLSIHHLVELLVESFELSSLGHVVLKHELRCLQGRVVALGEELKTVVDQSLVKEDTPLSQKVSTVTDDLDTSLRVVTIKPK
jgi:hypothetical protein